MIVRNDFKNMDNSKPTTPKRTNKGTVRYLDGRPIKWAPVKSKIKKRQNRRNLAPVRRSLFNRLETHLCVCVGDQQEIEIGWTNLNGEVVTSDELSSGPTITAFIPLVISVLGNGSPTEN